MQHIKVEGLKLSISEADEDADEMSWVALIMHLLSWWIIFIDMFFRVQVKFTLKDMLLIKGLMITRGFYVNID